MNTLYETITGITDTRLRQLNTCIIGQVTSIFPHEEENDFDNYECNVMVEGTGGELRKVPVSTPHIGSVCIPNVGDLVVVVFIRGDIHQPVIIGRLYNDLQRAVQNKPDQYIIHLPHGAQDKDKLSITLAKNAEDPKREVKVELADAVSLVINDNSITAIAGKTRLSLSQPGSSDGLIEVTAGKTKLTLNQDGDVLVESEAAMQLSAKGDLSLQAANISLKSDQATKIEAGTEASFKAGTSATIESSANMKIKGAMVDIN